MRHLSGRTVDALPVLVFYAAATTPGFAMDPVCSQVITVTQKLKTLPFHLYMTETQNITNAAMAKSAGQIGMGGTKQSEEISTGKNIYVMTGGRWIDMQMSFATMEQDKDSDADAKQALEESQCKALPDEVMYGQPAHVYLRTNPGLGIEVKLWVSKATNYPIRTDMTNDQGVLKMLTVSRYDYNDVQAPAHAITMKEMVKNDNGG